MARAGVGLDGVVHNSKFTHTGTLERFIIKGVPYGFILNDFGDQDFIHLNDFDGITPRVGMRLRYQLGKDDQGRYKAVNIQVIE